MNTVPMFLCLGVQLYRQPLFWVVVAKKNGDRMDFAPYMGQKDKDRYYAETCHIVFNFGA